MKTAYKRRNAQSLVITIPTHIFKDASCLAEVLHSGTHVGHLQQTLVPTPAVSNTQVIPHNGQHANAT